MRRIVPLLLMTLVVFAATWVFLSAFRVSGLDSVSIQPRDSGGGESSLNVVRKKIKSLISSANPGDELVMAPGNPLPTISIATFNLGSYDSQKARKPQVVDVVARIAREFDILAVQEVRSNADDLLPKLVGLINQTGKVYDFAIGPRVGPKDKKSQYAFIFDTKTVELDRSELYTIDDRHNLMSYDPFVGWFRTRGSNPESAFTFTLVNVQIDPVALAQEINVLDDILFAVRDDGRGEDDVILLGDFQTAPGQFGDIDRISNVGFSVINVPTNVESTATLDNLIFHKPATGEFSGHAGVFDFLRKYNLDLETALEISDHLPVWAQFSVFEGGEVGRVATTIDAPMRH